MEDIPVKKRGVPRRQTLLLKLLARGMLLVVLKGNRPSSMNTELGC